MVTTRKNLVLSGRHFWLLACGIAALGTMTISGFAADPLATNAQPIAPANAQGASTVQSTRRWWIPEKVDTIYGAITGGLIALISGLTVSVLTNRYASRRQKIELGHQAEQKERERQYALK